MADLTGGGATDGNDHSSKITEAKPISSRLVPDRSGPPEPINDGITSLQIFDSRHNREAMERLEATNTAIEQREKADEPPLIAPPRHGQALPK